ncbi:unnamed protein product [Darwinula stevensoni]|uniref:Tetraspanin n=1 Tax=Darwinula stevensoni TaxID=69355 RepID=A0A7R9A4Y5_9CRUS|nr:unnamed protein product [Darwinula stevensoni]CAG0890902.1 unnamed protein product [Darwinula stevensoni]
MLQDPSQRTRTPPQRAQSSAWRPSGLASLALCVGVVVGRVSEREVRASCVCRCDSPSPFGCFHEYYVMKGDGEDEGIGIEASEKMAGCGAKCAKAVLVAFNFFFWISGCVLLAIGIWIIVDPSKTRLFGLVSDASGASEVLPYMAYALCSLGGFVILVGFFGCCGALQENKCMLVTYFLCLFLILCAELTVGIFCYIYRDFLLKDLQHHLKGKLKRDYGKPEHKTFTDSMDYIQFKFACCGIEGDQDYNQSHFQIGSTQYGNRHYPYTCCRLSNANDPDAWEKPTPIDPGSCETKQSTQNTRQTRYTIGCFQELRNWFELESLVLIIIALGVGGMEVFGMIFSICLCRNIGEEA